MKFKLIIIVFLLILASFVTPKKTNIHKRHPIKTIRVKDGDIVDCIEIYKQPAFDHPVLKNHTIQMKSTHLDPTKETPRTMQNSNSSNVLSQLWLQYGSCPNGTIPIRRSSNNHQTNAHPGKVVITKDHSFSVVLTEGLSYSGAKGTIKVWNPFVESIGDYSSSQVTLRISPLKVFETAQAGWAVNPIVYNDAKTRLFAYWSVDGMRNTGCFDLTCPGFVQTSSEVLLGGEIGRSEITIQISKDPVTSNWWLKYNDKEVGYWPGDIFQLMKYQATSARWGGEVYSPRVGTHPHTQTAMGNGEFSDRLSRRCGTITGLLIEANSNPPMRPEPEMLFTSADEWSCYDAYLLTRRVPEPVFFYGGPGARGNPWC